MQSVIRCKARQQLQLDPQQGGLPTSIDEALFKELATTLLESATYENLRQQCQTKAEATELGDRMAAQLVAAYQTIKARQQDPVIQNLNSSLNSSST